MLSLYLTQRRTEALAVYGRHAQLLAAELHAEPSANVKRLREIIVTEAPTTVHDGLALLRQRPTGLSAVQPRQRLGSSFH